MSDIDLQNIDPFSLIQSNIFGPKLDKGELNDLNSRFPNATYLTAQINIGYEYYQFLNSKKDRRGEIVFGLLNEKQQLLLHTKSQFPKGIFRLLSGGIDANEALIPSLEREIFEETGFIINDYNFLGIVFYKLQYKENLIPFISYIFQIENINGTPKVLDKSENICGFKWIDKSRIIDVYNTLLNVPPDWQDWGKVRAYPHLFFNINGPL